MPQEKYPLSCPWDLGPNQKLSDLPEWILKCGRDFVKFSKDPVDHNYFFVNRNDETTERVLAYKARLAYQKLLDKGFKLKIRR
tara:strand:- start:204 stop:452 length:249 start_codon:yes stop_codon:yes gene_type:complete